MAVNVRLKHSSVDSKAPVAADLLEGEIALNINENSPAAYIKNSAGQIVKIAGENSVSIDTDAVKKSVTTPQNMAGDLTLNTDKITLDATEGNASFGSGDVQILNNDRLYISRTLYNGLVFGSSPASTLSTYYKEFEIIANKSLGTATNNTIFKISTNNTSANGGGPRIDFKTSLTDKSGGAINLIGFNFNGAGCTVVRVDEYGLKGYSGATGEPNDIDFSQPAWSISNTGAASFPGSLYVAGNTSLGNTNLLLGSSYGVVSPFKLSIGSANDTCVSSATGTKAYKFEICETGNEFGHNLTFNAIRRGLPDLAAFTISGGGGGSFYGTVTAANITVRLEADDDTKYTTTTEEYTETESYTGPLGNTLEREVTKTREIRTYTGPTLDVKDELQSLRARATQQDEVIAMMTQALKDLGADVSTFPAPADEEPKTRSRKKK